MRLAGTAGWLAVAVTLGGIWGVVVFGRPGTATDPRPVPACAEEDGGPYPCVWDGPHRGNRTGDRVIVWSDD
jgi:hypothetical protein